MRGVSQLAFLRTEPSSAYHERLKEKRTLSTPWNQKPKKRDSIRLPPRAGERAYWERAWAARLSRTKTASGSRHCDPLIDAQCGPVTDDLSRSRLPNYA